MNSLRRIHLYLGCIFAPLLIFFAVSGIWQLFGLQRDPNNRTLSTLSSIHYGKGTKLGSNLSTPLLKYVTVAMALSLVLSILLGVIMAFKFGHWKPALMCLGMGLFIPILIIVIHRL